MRVRRVINVFLSKSHRVRRDLHSFPTRRSSDLRSGTYSSLQPGGRFKDNTLNMPCQQPPWGELVAVNVNTGDIAWKDRKSTRLNSSHPSISYAVFCLKKKTNKAHRYQFSCYC